MASIKQTIEHLRILHTWAIVYPKYDKGISVEECKSVAKWTWNALELLDAYEKLKTQHEFILKEREKELAMLKSKPKITLCKDCIYRKDNLFCKLDGQMHLEDWYCACGEEGD